MCIFVYLLRYSYIYMLDGKLKIIKTIFLHRIEIIITSSVDCRSSDRCTYPLKFVDGGRNVYYVYIGLFVR